MARLMLHILLAIAIALFGASKGYNGVLSGVAGFFGGIFALVIFAILPDKHEEQARAEDRRHCDEEINALRQRVEELEAAQSAGAEAPAAEPEAETLEKAPLREGEPARFAARTRDLIACLCCGKRQMGNRDLCYSCGLPFVYDEDETT